MLAGINPGSYGGGIDTDLSKPLPPAPPDAALEEITKENCKPAQETRAGRAERATLRSQRHSGILYLARTGRSARRIAQQDQARTLSGRLGGSGRAERERSAAYTPTITIMAPAISAARRDEESVKRLEAIVTKGSDRLPPDGPILLDRTAASGMAGGKSRRRPRSRHLRQSRSDVSRHHARRGRRTSRYTGEMELTNHSAGSLTSQAYQKRWLRKEELLADAAEKASLAAEWLGARPYPLAATE